MCRKYNFSTIEDLYASIGYGGLSAQKVILRLREEYAKLKKSKKETETEQGGGKIKKTNYNGIEVEGIENCLVRLAGCCNPVPGDEIKGFITKGRGVSVHRADCSNIRLESLPEEDRNRFIPVKWVSEKQASYIATLQIEADDRIGMLMNVASCLADLKINCTSVDSRITKNSIAIMNVGLEISDAADVKKAMNKIKQIPGVLSVVRKTN